MNKYFKNFILVGEIDHRCLLCKETFNLIIDIEKHVRWENHRREIKNQNCLPKFKKESIFKIADHYYCETCNYVAETFDAITSHVSSENHKITKNKPETLIKKPIGHCDAGTVKIGKVMLNKQQWHCIVDGKCSICVEDVTNVDDHINSQKHMIRLIQSTTTIDGERCYRKINDGLYQCYTCKKTFSEAEFRAHCDAPCTGDTPEINPPIAGSSSEYGTGSRMANIEKKLIKTLEGFFDVDEKSSLASCKYCDATIAVDFRTMIEHMKNKHDGSDTEKTTKEKANSSDSSEEEVIFREVPDHGKRRAELAKYGKEHGIKLNNNASKGLCTICYRYLSAHKNVFREHIRGTVHKSHLEFKGDRKPRVHAECDYDKLNINTAIVKFSQELGVFWVQCEFCIELHSFHLLFVVKNNPHHQKSVCLACDEIFDHGKEREHCSTPTHKKNFFSALVILKDGEFIREIRDNLFHCGICNQTIPFWDTVEKHISTLRHKFQKNERWILYGASKLWQEYSPSAVYINPNNSPKTYDSLLSFKPC